MVVMTKEREGSRSEESDSDGHHSPSEPSDDENSNEQHPHPSTELPQQEDASGSSDQGTETRVVSFAGPEEESSLEETSSPNANGVNEEQVAIVDDPATEEAEEERGTLQDLPVPVQDQSSHEEESSNEDDVNSGEILYLNHDEAFVASLRRQRHRLRDDDEAFAALLRRVEERRRQRQQQQQQGEEEADEAFTMVLRRVVEERRQQRREQGEEADEDFEEFFRRVEERRRQRQEQQQGEEEESYQPRTCLGRCCRLYWVRQTISILTYPLVVMTSLISMIVVITFCLFPTLILIAVSICLYYTCVEDPIPFPALLRSMLAPDPASDEHHPHEQRQRQRPVIRSKLIVRRLERVEENSTASTSSSKQSHHKKDQRRRSGPIEIVTESHKCLYFSEPLLPPSPVPEEEESSDVDVDHDDVANDFDTNTTTAVVTSSQRQDPLSLRSTVAAGLPLQVLDEAETTSDPNSLAQEEEDDDDPIINNDGNATDPGEDDDSIVDLELGNPSNILSDDSATARPPPLDEGESDSKVEDLEKQQEPVSVSPKGQHTAAKEEEEEDIDYFGIEAQRDRGTACDICLLEYRVGETVAWSPNLQCSHSYHEDCILDWLVRKPTCPNCRNNYLKG